MYFNLILKLYDSTDLKHRICFEGKLSENFECISNKCHVFTKLQNLWIAVGNGVSLNGCTHYLINTWESELIICHSVCDFWKY